MAEAMTILKAAAHTLDQHTGLSFHGSHNVAHLDMEPQESPQSFFPDLDALDNFAEYCRDTMEPSSSGPMVSFIKRFQSHGRESGPAEPCKHTACSRTHPVNECCICRGPHFVNRCWHVLGLPDGIAVIKDNFVKQHATNEGPWNRNNAPPRAPRHNGPHHKAPDRTASLLCNSKTMLPGLTPT
jgi:hypothetical protein